MNTKQLRQKILDLVIRGKLVPQDPNDEPASVLLERVRAEKERLIKEGKIKRDKKDSAVFRGDDKLHYEQLPDGWAWCRLGSIVNEIATGPFGTMLHKSDYIIGGIPMVNPQHIIDGSIIPSEKVTVNQGTAKRLNSYRLNVNDVIIGRRGEMGRCAVVLEFQKGWLCGTGCFILRSNQNINSDFLAMTIRSERIVAFLLANSIGATMSNLNHSILNQILLPLPPLAEQHRIVAAIESAFTVIDEIERNKTDLQSAVAAAKSKILSLAIRGKLVPQDPNDEPASVLLERIRAERETLIKAGKIKRGKNDSATKICRDNSYYDVIPSSWVLCTLDDIGITNIGLTYKPSEICADGTPVLRSSNIKDGVLDYTDLIRVNTVFSNSLELSESDILICARNGSRHLVGKCALIPKTTEKMTFGAFMAVYRSECSHFIYHFFNSHFFRRVFESEGISTQINQLTQAMIKETIIPLPPLAEQRRIVIAIEAAFEQLDSISAMLV